MPVDTMQHQTPRTGPLAGIRIVDMTSVMLGPLATMLLADLGADVIKLESPRGSGGGSAPGDIWRYAGRAPAPGMGPMFAALNRNKRAAADYFKECTPSYLTNEGNIEQYTKMGLRAGSYGPGSQKFFELWEQWRSNGNLQGLQLSKELSAVE